MFGTIRKHQTWLWGIIITLTVVSFLFAFGPASRMNNSGGRRNGSHGAINGDKISDQDYLEASKEVDLHNFFMTGGHWLSEDKKRTEQEVERQIYQWLLLNWEQKRMGIHVDEATAADYAKHMMRAFERAGVSSPQMFVERILQPHGLQIDDFQRYIRHFIGLQQLITTVGLSGRLVTEQEAKGLYERDHQELASEAVLFSASNYLSSVTVTPQMVSQYYSNRVANYGIPERVVVSYVRFNVTNYFKQAETDLSTNLNEIVDSNFQRLGKNASIAFPDAKTPADVKARIREQIIRRQALSMAGQKANDFARKLFDIQPAVSTNLEAMASTNGLQVSVTEPFDRDQEPKGLEVGADFNKVAFSLSPDDPFGGPLAGQDGVYLIAYQKRLPYELPPLDTIRARVEADCKRSQAMALAQQAARSFFITATNGLAQGKNFTNLCADAKVNPMQLPPFSISTRSLPEVEDIISLNQLKQAAFSTQPGKLSMPQPTPEGAMLLFIKTKLPMDTAKMRAELPDYMNSVRRNRQQEAFDAWFRHEAERGLRDIPALQQTPQLGSAAS